MIEAAPCSTVAAPRSLPPVVGLCGRAGAGKTTGALGLVGALPSCCRISFADPLRAMLLALGLTAWDLSEGKETPHLLLGGVTPRRAMQTLGTEWGRLEIVEDLWLRVARKRALEALQTFDLVVFDDVRFDNEAEMIRGMGGIILQVENPALPARLDHPHPSERGISPTFITRTIIAQSPEDLKTRLLAHLTA